MIEIPPDIKDKIGKYKACAATRKFRDKLKTAGLCVFVCGRPATQGNVSCELCRQKENQRTRKRYKRARKIGKCTKCHKLAANGKIWCDSCSEKYKYNSLYYTYGLTKQDYDVLFDKQKGVCGICGKSESKVYKGVAWKLSVDHDHNTGKIRGLLCNNCNRALGLMQERKEVLYSAIKWISQEVT